MKGGEARLDPQVGSREIDATDHVAQEALPMCGSGQIKVLGHFRDPGDDPAGRVSTDVAVTKHLTGEVRLSHPSGKRVRDGALDLS